MANGATLPPWLDINPLAGVPMYLQGYGQGASVGESRRRAEERAYELDAQQAAAQERNEILREARQIQAQEFAENLKLKQEQAQRAAKMAAIRLEGQQGLERDLQSGMTFQEAFPRHAPKLLFEEPASMAQLFRQTQPQKNITPSVMEFEGQKYLVNPATGGFDPIRPPTPESVTAVPIKDSDGNVIGYGRVGQGGNIIPLPAPKTAKAPLTEKGKIELQKQQFNILKQQKDLTPGSPEAIASTNLVKAIDAALTSAAPSGTKVKLKGTNKTFIYRGDPNDIPLDQYEIVK